MSAAQTTVLLKYANLQMAAEALLDRGGNLQGLLEQGNTRASRVPALLAQKSLGHRNSTNSFYIY